MISENVFEIICSITNDRFLRRSLIFLTVFAILIGFFIGCLPAIITFSCYISGYITTWFLIKYPNKLAEYFHRSISFYRSRILSVRKTLRHSCSICDDLSCRRYQQNISITPWKHLHISRDLNEALEQFYDTIIENFITSWYAQFTRDNDFLNELRYCFRYATATVINRILELDVADIITNKLVPCAVRHIDDYIYIQQIAKLKNARINEVTIEYMGKRLHVAAANRKNELAYLQHLVSSLLENILPKTYLKCRNFSIIIREILAGWVLLPLMDVLADPNIINSLVILTLTYKSKKPYKTEVNSETVEFLEHFTAVNSKTSPFATNLNKIKKNTDLLYAFMQFLKKQENVNMLQFCLDVDEFNVKLLTPELSKKQLEDLDSEAVKLYKDYLDRDSFNFIGCPVTISDDFGFTVKDDSDRERLTKLSKILYKAYEHTFNELESNWLPHFFHSNEFYGYICGTKVVPSYNKPNRSALVNFGSPIKDRAKKYDSYGQGTVAKISSSLGKIRGVLKTTQPVEGAFFPIEAQNVEDGTVEDILLGECKNIFRDLSTWNVSIPSYQASPLNKVIYFCINVERLDALSENSKKNWLVLRKDQDFYTLKAKLVEFHGETEICDSPLPSRKAGSSIETRMKKYEEFIKKLVQKPMLKGSDLLYSFLTTEEDFSVFVATNAPNIQDIGNIYQSVAYKLRKEKGQHLDSFMTSFLNSTGKSRNDKIEFEVGEEFDMTVSASNKGVQYPKTYKNHVFNDNFGVNYNSLKDTMGGSVNPTGLTDSIFYLLKNVFKLRNGALKIYVTLCSVAHQWINSLCNLLIERKLRSSLCHSNLAFLVRYLQDIVFNPYPSPTKEELEKRKQRAFSELEKVVPSLVSKILGTGVSDGLRTILEILQNPHYNKQIAYNFLDIILLEMYPSLEKCEETT